MADIDLHDNNGDPLVGTAASLLGLSWLCVGLRTYTRARLTKPFLADDWLMLVAQAIFTLSCAFILRGVALGVGRHNAAINDDKVKVQALKYQALSVATYVLDMMFIKLSIGVFLLRLAVERVYAWIIWVSLTIITIWSTVIFIWAIFQCTPVEKQWDYTIRGGHCASAESTVSAAYGVSVMNVLSDWLYALLPVFMVWKVNMTLQAKLTVTIVLGLGIFASVATLVRLKFLANLKNERDILFAGTDAMIWTLIEPGIAITAANLATIRPLLRKLRIKGFESSQDSSSRRSDSMGVVANRSKRSNTLIFGNESLQLETVNLGRSHDGEIRTVPVNTSDTLFDSNGSLQNAHNHTHNEMEHPSPDFIITPWQARMNSSSTRSLEQIHDLEAQCQENSKFGLGNEGR